MVGRRELNVGGLDDGVADEALLLACAQQKGAAENRGEERELDGGRMDVEAATDALTPPGLQDIWEGCAAMRCSRADVPEVGWAVG